MWHWAIRTVVFARKCLYTIFIFIYIFISVSISLFCNCCKDFYFFIKLVVYVSLCVFFGIINNMWNNCRECFTLVIFVTFDSVTGKNCFCNCMLNSTQRPAEAQNGNTYECASAKAGASSKENERDRERERQISTARDKGIKERYYNSGVRAFCATRSLSHLRKTNCCFFFVFSFQFSVFTCSCIFIFFSLSYTFD